ncbi:hypothetical protein RhiirA5_437996 [Rhizophagus irregularis]|uniref:Uncharacterized protein n=1 Tax=Rhizophagus irregularis TaxID=588596 RepID=A0A2N0NJR2_9GLOM|nr:hypothetical protein RhiirA5_437996 [Rhizophagus irregularis]
MSDIMEIHEKYKTPTHYKNFISTIVFTNENALRVENDDRRTVFLDVSPSHKGDLNYFKKLGDAMKYPGASKAFYAYLRAIADVYLNFNGNPPPMTTSKQEHIISTLPPLFQFIKDTYLVMKNYMTDLPVQEFYRVYTSYCETHYISPLSKINASRILSNELAINSKLVHEINIEGIDVDTPEKPTSDPKALEKFLANIYNPANNPQDVQEKPAEKKPKPAEEKPAEKKPEPAEEKPAPVIRKTPPPLPPKPDHLKKCPQESRKEKPSAPEPDDLLSDSDSTTVDPTPEQQPESPAESSAKSKSLADSKSSTEPEVDQNSEPKKGTRAHWAWQERHRWDRKPWAKYQDTSDDYDWEILAFEVEECPTTRIEDKYQYYLREVVDRFKDWIEYNGYLSKTPSRKELADLIRAYKENRNAEIMSTPSGYETMRADKGKAREIPEERPKTDMEREWEAANGLIDDWDEEDLDRVCSKIDSF